MSVPKKVPKKNVQNSNLLFKIRSFIAHLRLSRERQADGERERDRQTERERERERESERETYR